MGLIRIGGLLCVFLLQILLARLLVDSAAYGAYAWGQSLLFVAGGIAALGIPRAVSRFIAALEALGGASLIPPVVRKAWYYLLWSAAFTAILALALGLLWSGRVGGELQSSIVVIALFSAPAVSFMLLYQNMARARRWMVLAFLPAQLVRPLLTACLAVGAYLVLDGRITSELALGMMILSLAIVTSVQAVLYHRRSANPRPVPSGDTLQTSEYTPERLLPTALPMLTGRMAGLVMEYASVLVLGYIAGPAAAGIFFAAERLARLASIPFSVVESVAQPRFASTYARRDMPALQATVTGAAHFCLWPTLGAALFLMLLGRELLAVFGAEFVAAFPVLLVLLLGQLATVITGAGGDLLVMTGHQERVSRVLGASAAVHVLLLALLVPGLGPMGAAVTTACSALLSNVVLMLLVRRELGVKPTVLAGFGSMGGASGP